MPSVELIDGKWVSVSGVRATDLDGPPSKPAVAPKPPSKPATKAAKAPKAPLKLKTDSVISD